MSELPLKKFQPGQRLYFRKSLSGGQSLFCPGEFVRVERGFVIVKYLPGWTPTWMDERSLQKLFPEGTAKLRADSCCLWGKGNELMERCHWFPSLDYPAFEKA